MYREKNFKLRAEHFYREERANGNTALNAMRTARYKAKFGDGSHKQSILPLTWGTAYDDEEIHTLPNGWKIKFEIQYDNDHEPPWEDCDGMGVIEETRGYSKPGEYGEYDDWIMNSDRYWYRYYDWKATLPIAIRDGWDAAPYGVGTKRERAMRAMRHAYGFLRRWCNNDWWYVGLIVTLLDENDEELGEDSCWGFESDNDDYITEQMRDWAARLIVAARKKRRSETDAWKQLKLEIAA